MNLKVCILETSSIIPALIGIGLSYGLTNFDTCYLTSDEYQRLLSIAGRLAGRDGGHNKFLESINVTMLVRAPRYWWQEFDTYRVGVTKQSESTMHTITHRLLDHSDFAGGFIQKDVLRHLNDLITMYRETADTELKKVCFNKIKLYLPEGFLQTRCVALNLKALRNMWFQRRNHRLLEWRLFFEQVNHSLAPTYVNWYRKENNTTDDDV